ncbi:MAG: PQQ-binding-like beta-propeller repeat protein, partial [Opitutales bacterium]
KEIETTSSWPQWRGPSRNGIIPSESLWPAKIDQNSLKEKWRVKLGKGYSGPVVSNEMVFTTESLEEEEITHAYNRKDGKLVWSAKWKGKMKVPFFAAKNGSWIRSTPTFDGKNLFVCGMRDVLHSLNADTGEINWKVDFVERYDTPLPAFGMVCSPLINGDDLYVQAGSGFVKLDKRNGKSIWRSLQDKGGMFGSAFSSPVIEEINGKPQVVVQTRTDLAAVNPKNGKELWKQPIKAFRGMNILTPTVIGNSIFTSSYGGKSLLFNVQKEKESEQTLMQTWENRQEGYMSGPIILGDFCYIHLRKQRITCLDMKTGETQWISSESFGKYMSMVSNGKEILALDEDGTLYLIDPNPEKFVIKESRKISESP